MSRQINRHELYLALAGLISDQERDVRDDSYSLAEEIVDHFRDNFWTVTEDKPA